MQSLVKQKLQTKLDRNTENRDQRHKANSLQLSSSEESEQSDTPSHRAHGRIHSMPLAQRKSVDAQYADIQTSVFIDSETSPFAQKIT